MLTHVWEERCISCQTEPFYTFPVIVSLFTWNNRGVVPSLFGMVSPIGISKQRKQSNTNSSREKTYLPTCSFHRRAHNYGSGRSTTIKSWVFSCASIDYIFTPVSFFNAMVEPKCVAALHVDEVWLPLVDRLFPVLRPTEIELVRYMAFSVLERFQALNLQSESGMDRQNLRVV